MQVDHLLHLVCDFRFERNYYAQEVDRLKADGVQLRDQITSLTTVSDELRNDLVREKLKSSKALKELKEIQDLVGIIQTQLRKATDLNAGLATEVKRLKDQSKAQECSVCMDAEWDQVLLCGHPFCSRCVRNMYEEDWIKCVVCNRWSATHEWHGFLKVFK